MIEKIKCIIGVYQQMKTQEINDLAFKYIESRIVLNAGNIKKYFLDAGGTMEEIEFFMVFLKYWLDIKQLTSWQDIVNGVRKNTTAILLAL